MDIAKLISEVTYKAVRSSGSGGQNVNKVATKVELYYDLKASNFFKPGDKQRLITNLGNRLTKARMLILSCGETRSQLKNKQIVTQRFIELIQESLKEDKERIPTKTPKSVIRKRLANKKKNSEKKANRKQPKID